MSVRTGIYPDIGPRQHNSLVSRYRLLLKHLPDHSHKWLPWPVLKYWIQTKDQTIPPTKLVFYAPFMVLWGQLALCACRMSSPHLFPVGRSPQYHCGYLPKAKNPVPLESLKKFLFYHSFSLQSWLPSEPCLLEFVPLCKSPPLESGLAPVTHFGPVECSRGDTACLQRLGHKNTCSFIWVSWNSYSAESRPLGKKQNKLWISPS